VSLLEQDQVDWAILTNGKEWRLFSKKAHSRATNYYEIDLEEVIREQDPEMFRYFYLFFRLSAFVPDQQGKTFLELIREESSDYAKQLEDRLKDRIYEKIFPYLADGFISNYSKQKDIPPYQMESLAPGCLKEVFPATLTLLYRLLFILYAESRDLLPVREEIGYGACGLKKLKEEIASAAGDEFEEVENKLKRKYGSGTDDNRLYKYLNSLFDLIGKGDPDRNLPQYDGGLFDSSLNPFFQENHVPDYHLACAIDHLARDEDEKTSRVVFIDYKSLGVRQLGSIYEGLLEFKVRMATEKMAFCQGKKTEILLPYAQAKKNKDIKVLKIGHGSQAEERTLSCGTVYLENDKHERKATGSYYTPDHIVKYIVRHAVGPVLDSKFKEMTSAIREAQKVYHAEQKKSKGLAASGIKADDPENQAYLKTRHVVDDLFNIRCLDPAMGSGHFLVECVDYITDRIVVFLDGFAPWNPVSAHLERTRRDILNQMDSQNITISERRLDPINLLKRHILKRCIYGVDLNPMAVALAKVSLWLDCFTIGAPLSFLDHHLKCGNSLISSDVETVREAISTYTNKQLTIFGSYWTGSLQALQGMLNVGFLPDATPSQAKESLTQYRKASDHLEPFRRMLDVYTSRWFGNEPVKKKGKIPEPTLDFLNDKEGEAWIYGKKSTEEVRPAFREIAEKVVKASQEKRFFHWDLEFPEVFYAPRPGTMQQIERAANAGFDAVIGNPPYDVLAEQELGYDLSQEFAYFRAAQIYSPAIKGKLNLYKLFISIALYLTRAKGTFSFIVPMGLLGDDQTAGVRHLLLNSSGLVSIEVFPQKDDEKNRVFLEAKLPTVIFVTRKQESISPILVRTHKGRFIEEGSDAAFLTPEIIIKLDEKGAVIPSCTQRDLEILISIFSDNSMKKISDYCQASQGEINETADGKKGYVSRNHQDGPHILRGSNICLYILREASQGEPIYLRKEEYLNGKPDSIKAQHHLQNRIGWQESSAQNNFRRIIAAKIPRDMFCNHKINYIPEGDSSLNLDLLLAILNSKISDWLFRLSSTSAAVSHYQILRLPIPYIKNTERCEVVDNMINLKHWYKLKSFALNACTKPGSMPNVVAYALIEMSRQISKSESARKLNNRSERSSLSPESQEIQDVIDSLLFRCYGLSEEEGEYIATRLKEML
jgi:type I restriction-modification system DNA methylase subunit